MDLRKNIRFICSFITKVPNTIEEAILREKQLKKWKRLWKINLIESFNLELNDLYEIIL